jgi:hypothetical protein
MAQGYVIHVGQHAPEKVIIAQPDKNGNPKGDVFETYKQMGSYLLMNRCRVWCRRVGTDGKLPKNKDTQAEEVLEVTDTRYKGNLEFLNWGDNKLGAQAIEIRFLPISQTLDYEYQNSVQKIQIRVEEDQAQIELKPGENKFDTEKEALKVQMIKVHPQNRDSKSKNPDPMIKGYTYYEVSDEQVDKTFVKNKEAGIIAGRFVVDLSAHPQRLKNLLEIFKGYDADNEILKDVNHLSNDTDVYSALLKFADVPGTFGQLVNRYKQELQDKFELAKSYKALDLTKNGSIAMTVDNKKDLVWDNAEGKGDAMIEWVMENFLKEDVYERTQHFKALCSKLK